MTCSAAAAPLTCEKTPRRQELIPIRPNTPSMKTRMLLLLPLLLLAAAVVQAQQTAEVDVRSFGAKGDGVTDDTAAVQRALDSMAEKGGTVKLGIGNYLIKTHLVVPANVTLEGIWRIPTARTQNIGSTLLAVEGEGSEEGPAFITLNANSTIKGLTVFYPNQKANDIKPYPWCVRGAGGDNSSIVDCLLVNPYLGVDFGTNPSGRHYIRNLYGQPLRKGIFVDKCLDIGRIENVHFWPFWTWDAESGIQEWLSENGEAFIFGRTDWEYVFNTFCFGYKIGYRFIKTEMGSMNGNLLGIAADAANIAVLVEECQRPGLLITNGEFVSIYGDKPTMVVTTETNTGVLQFQNCSFWGPAYQIARLEGKGNTTFNNCNFLTWGYLSMDWSQSSEDIPAIHQLGGTLSAVGNQFLQARPQLKVDEPATSAIFVANMLAGQLSVTSAAGARLEVGLNAQDALTPAAALARPNEEPEAIVVDDAEGSDRVRFEGTWYVSPEPGNYYRSTRWARKGTGDSRAFFRPEVPEPGKYDVFVFVSPDPMSDHATNAPVTVRHQGGEDVQRIDTHGVQTGRWVKIGSYQFARGATEIIFSNDADNNIVADAVKLLPAK